MNKKKLTIIIGAILLLIISYFYFGSNSDEDVSITAEVTRGVFLDEVIISGEAQSTSSKKINAPSNARRFGIYNMKIQDLVPEGTVVKKGGYIGTIEEHFRNEFH